MANRHAARDARVCARPGLPAVAWGIAAARQARIAAGLDPAALRVGAYVNVGCYPDPAVARALVRGSTAIFARFSAMSATAGPAFSHEDAAVIGQVGRRYDEARHGLSDAAHAGSLDDEFVDRFAVAGPAAQSAARLRGLFELGLDGIVVVPGSRDTGPEFAGLQQRALRSRGASQAAHRLDQAKAGTWWAPLGHVA